jgi:hypothetical protein
MHKSEALVYYSIHAYDMLITHVENQTTDKLTFLTGHKKHWF